MGHTTNFNVSGGKPNETESLHINFNKGKIKNPLRFGKY